MQSVSFSPNYWQRADAGIENRSSRSAAIKVRGLRKAYADHEVLHGIDLDVYEGEVFALLGTNGAGKTTTIEILEAYRPRQAGEVQVLGLDPARPTRAWRDRIGFVLQDCRLNPVLTVRETLTLFSAFYSRPRRLDDLINLVGLDDQADARVGTLSGGQQRRADVAVALIGDPDLIFLDEPTTGLDPAARRDAWRMIKDLRQGGKTILLTTHYMDEAQHLSDRVAIMQSGKIVASGPPSQLTSQQAQATRLSFRLPDGVALNIRALADGQEATVEDGIVTFRSDRPQELLRRILDWADSEHMELADLSVWKPSLEEIFLDLTGGTDS